MAIFDSGSWADEGVEDFGVLADMDAVHEDRVLANGPFFHHDFTGDNAVVNLAEDHRALVDQAVFDLGLLADILRAAMGIGGIDLIRALDGVDVGRVVLLKEQVHIGRMERIDGADVPPIALILISDHLLLGFKHLRDDVLAEVMFAVLILRIFF